MSDVPVSTLGQIESGLAAAGIVDGVMLKKVRRHHLKKQMPQFLLEFTTAKGFFFTEQEIQWMRDAKDLMETHVLKQMDVQFEKVKVFEGVPWPSLNAIPNRIITATDRKLWLLGRSSFASLHESYLSTNKDHLDFDGTPGSGKTYLQLMLACRCYHDFKGTEKRLICLFEMPVQPNFLLLDLKKAIVVAFWDTPWVQRKVLASENLDELAATVEELKRSYKLFFIFDEWSVLDEPVGKSRTPSCQKVYEIVCALEAGCRSLHGGSARSNNMHTANCKGQYDPLSEEELALFLTREDVPKHSQLFYYTGLLPLYVRLFVSCQKKAAPGDDAELLDSFCNSHEIRVMQTGFFTTVYGITDKSNLHLYSQLITGSASVTKFKVVDDQRWVVVTKDGQLALFSEHARLAFMQVLEEWLSVEDLDVIIDNFSLRVLDECSRQVPNKSLIGFLIERIVVHIAKRWVIAENHLLDKDTKLLEVFKDKPTFEELSTRFGSSWGSTIRAALKAVDKLGFCESVDKLPVFTCTSMLNFI